MKVLLLSLAVLCIVACNVQAQRNRLNPGFPPRSTGPTFPKPPRQPNMRFRRESPEEPQLSITDYFAQRPTDTERHLSFDINGPRDGIRPTYGSGAGWIFRRELPEELEEAVQV